MHEHESRFEDRQRREKELSDAAVRDLVSVSHGAQPEGFRAGANPLVTALRIVAGASGVEIRDVTNDFRSRDPLQTIAEMSGIRLRKIVLQGRWWEQEYGPLLGSTADTNEPVPLLPARSRFFRTQRYDTVDIATGKRRRIDAELAVKLSPSAYTLYRPLPEPVRPLALARFVFGGLWRDVAMIFMCGVAVTLLGMLLPQATGIVIDYALRDSDRAMLFDIALGLGAAALSTLLFDFAQAASLLRVETLTTASLQAGVWDRLLKLRPSFFRHHSAGDLHSRAAAISAIRQRLGGVTLSTLFAAAASSLNLLLMFYYSPTLGLVALGLTVVVVAVSLSSGIVISGLLPMVQEIEGQLSGLMVQIVEATSKLRIAGAEQRAFAYWASAYGRKQQLSYSVSKLQDRIRLMNAILPALSPALIFWTASRISNAGGFSLGTFLAFNAALAAFVSGVTTFSDTGLELLHVPSLWRRAKTLLDAELEITPSAMTSIRLSGAVKLEHVTFRYRDDGPLTLDTVSIEAKAGQCIALAGPSGGGKSTLLSVLLGFEKPVSGAVYYDEHDLKGLNLTDVRRQIGVVMQDNKIMAGSIFENIACGTLCSISDAWEAARSAGLAEDIEQMPMGMHTMVSESGTNLSGGQRQRLLIARALVLKPSILILDEATSALDNRTQALVMQNLDSLKVTRILVAHRLSTIQHADCIYVIDGGRVVQSGTFSQLTNEDGVFARLMARQMA